MLGTEFASICRPSASSVEAWLFRKIFKSGSVVPNAIVSADVDGDGHPEILMGSTEGEFSILKPNRRTTLLSVPVPGTVSAVCYHRDTAFVVSMEGVLCVFSGLSQIIQSSCHTLSSPTSTHCSRSVTVPANATCMDVCGSHLVLGSSDRKVHLIDLVTFSHVRSYFIGSQVFSLVSFEAPLAPVSDASPAARPFVFAAGTSHLALIDPQRCDTVDATLGPCEWTFRVDRSPFRRGRADTLDEQVENPALPICAAALAVDGISFVAAATEDGYCYLFSVHTSSIDGPLIVSPVWVSGGNCEGVKLPGGIQRIFMCSSTFDTGMQCAVVVLSSSGEVHVIDDRMCLAVSHLVANACAFAFMGILPGDKISVAAVTTDEITCFRIPCASLGANGCTASHLHTRTAGTSCSARGCLPQDAGCACTACRFADWVTVGRVLFPLLSAQSDTFVAQRAMQSLLFGYSSAEWGHLIGYP